MRKILKVIVYKNYIHDLLFIKGHYLWKYIFF